MFPTFKILIFEKNACTNTREKRKHRTIQNEHIGNNYSCQFKLPLRRINCKNKSQLITPCVFHLWILKWTSVSILNRWKLKCYWIESEWQATFFCTTALLKYRICWLCSKTKRSNQRQWNKQEKNTTFTLMEIRFLLVSLDSLPADTPRCAVAVCVPHSSHIQIPEDLHIWNTYIRHPRHSWLSDLTPRAVYLGNCLKWWKSWASLSRLETNRFIKTGNS
jgi:hypothetical protein